RVGDWLKSDSGKGVADGLTKIKELTELESKAGIKLSDIERITFVAPKEISATNPKVSWGIVSTSKEFDQKKILSLIPNNKEEKHNNKTFYSSPNLCVHFVSSKIAVIGEASGVKNFLASTPSSSGGLSDGLRLAEDTKYHMVAGFQLPESFRQQLKALQGGGMPMRRGGFPERGMGGGMGGMGGMGGTSGIEPFLQFQSATLTAILGAKTELDLRLNFSDSSSAGKVKEALEQVKQQVPLIMMMAKG